MNWYFTTAGILSTMTGFVHMILGEKWIFQQLPSSQLQTHYSGDVTKTTLRWFWHFGSFMIFFIAGVTLFMAFTDGVIASESTIGILFATIYLGLNCLLILLHINQLNGLKEYPQLLIMIAIMCLLYLGSING